MARDTVTIEPLTFYYMEHFEKQKGTSMDITTLTSQEAQRLIELLQEKPAPQQDLSGRAVVVLDRGWIFAGDLSVVRGNYVRIENVLHVVKWAEIGFTGLVQKGATSSKVTLKACPPIEVPKDVIIFIVPVSADWGL